MSSDRVQKKITHYAKIIEEKMPKKCVDYQYAGKHKKHYTEIPTVHNIDNKAFLINPTYHATARQKGL